MNLAIDQVWYCGLDWPGTHYLARLLQNTATWLSLLNTQITGLRHHVQLKYLKLQNNKNDINLAYFRIYSQYKKESYHSTLVILLNLALMIFSSQNWIYNLSTLNPKLKGSSQLIKRVYLLTTPNAPSFQPRLQQLSSIPASVSTWLPWKYGTVWTLHPSVSANDFSPKVALTLTFHSNTYDWNNLFIDLIFYYILTWINDLCKEGHSTASHTILFGIVNVHYTVPEKSETKNIESPNFYISY